MKKRTPLYLAILGAFVLIFVEIARYSYINRSLMRQENVSHLQASYAQVARTFALFAERNWKLLDEWDSDLPNQFYNLTSEEAWSVIRDKAARWQYSELYMFNQNGEYSSVSGRHGISPHKESVFMAIYDENRPVLTSYPSTDGARKVVFAKPIRTPVLMEGSTYTGLAVTFRNDVLEKTISVSLYDGASDCYMVKRDGTVVLSLESQTEIDELHGNILDFVDNALAVSRSEKAEMRADIAEGKSGGLVGWLEGEEYYIVYQPSGMEDWSIVGVVRASVVEAGARKMQADTISLATLIASLTMLGVSWLILANMKAEAKSLKMEQQMLSRQKEVSDRLFTGMGRIADRYAVCDLVRDRYEYHENMLSKPLYPESGRYRDFIELMSRRYLVLGKAEGMKMDQILDPEYLRRVLRKETDILKFEYCIREKNVYALLNIIPVMFDGDGLLTQVMMIGQDVGQKVELENLANTDGLTGLYNERYFSRVLANLEKKKMPFALYYLDLDFFKPINDTYGHDMGDKLLKAVIEGYTREAGVRELERVLAKVVRKAVVEMLDEGAEIVAVTPQKLRQYLGAPRFSREQPEKTASVGMVNGLAYTSVGGEMLTVECLAMPGTGALQLTGKLGDVMQESAKAALSWARAHSEPWGLEADYFKKHDIHIHVPEGAVPKDGPSAGVTLTTALVSVLTGIPVRQDIAMTGEITLRGKVLPIGGLKEKLMAAYRAGITEVLIPEENVKDLEEVAPVVKEQVHITPVRDVTQVLERALTAPLPAVLTEALPRVAPSDSRQPTMMQQG